MPRKPALLTYHDRICEVAMDGCGSTCSAETCPAMANGLCRGCTKCDFHNACPEDGCKKCWVRCWQRKDIQNWIDDVEGLEYKSLTCSKPFTADLPLYVPQVRDNIWNTEHPAYIMNVDRIVHKSSRRWLYRSKGVHTHCSVPKDSIIIASFCLKDAFLEEIWRRHIDFQDGESFWDGFAKYDFAGTMSIEYSCYSNHPRMEHAISVKRNLLSAQKLAKAGVPVLLDVMFHTDQDFEQLVDWGKDNGIVWHVLNFQYTKRVPWVMDMLKRRIARLIEKNPEAKALILGIGDVERISILGKTFGPHVSVANASVYMNTAYHRIYQPETATFVFNDAPLETLFKTNLKRYTEHLASLR